MTEPLLQALARFAAALDLSRVPPEVKRQAALCVLDTIGCILAGAATPEGATLLAAERGGGTGPARVLGTDLALPAEAAARVHGYWGDIFELNDLIGGHASIGNIAAALALAEGSDGATLLRAVVAGIEVTTRIYSAVYPQLKPYTEVGMVVPGLVSAFGAAAVAGTLRGFDTGQMQEAMAIAGALTTWCPAEVIFGEGGTVKPMLFGALPAATGLRAASYAARGMTGPARLLESPLGLFATLCRAWDPAVLTDDTRWYLARPRRKLHACCGYIHSAVDAAIALRLELGASVLQGGRLEILMPGYVLPAVSKARPPRTPNDARFHAEYCIALAALGADVILPGHSLALERELASPALRDMLGRITLAADPALGHYHQCRLRFTTADGQRRELAAEAPKGSPQNPMSDAEVVAKFRRLTAECLSSRAAADYAERCLALEEATDCCWLFDLARG